MRAHLSRLVMLDYRLYRTLALAWMALIFYLSHQSYLGVPGVFEHQDKFMHFGAYAALGVFIAAGWHRVGVTLSPRDVALIVLAVALYGASDEFHQSFVPGREVSIWDLTADTLGGWFGASVVRWLRTPRATP